MYCFFFYLLVLGLNYEPLLGQKHQNLRNAQGFPARAAESLLKISTSSAKKKSDLEFQKETY